MYSKETEIMGLPQWTPHDHPDFLTDMNTAFNKIDVLGRSAGSISQLVQSVGLLGDITSSLREDVDHNTAVGSANEIAISNLQTNIGQFDALNRQVQGLTEMFNNLRRMVADNSMQLDRYVRIPVQVQFNEGLDGEESELKVSAQRLICIGPEASLQFTEFQSPGIGAFTAYVSKEQSDALIYSIYGVQIDRSAGQTGGSTVLIARKEGEAEQVAGSIQWGFVTTMEPRVWVNVVSMVDNTYKLAACGDSSVIVTSYNTIWR